MRIWSGILLSGMLVAALAAPAYAQPGDDGKLRIIVFGAHPDDAELGAAGVAKMWAERGHHVKFVAATNGDIGHWRMAGGPLAQRRSAEVKKAADILGIETQVLDNHDGELLPTLENRRTVTRLIREWKADIVITHRPNDYHPDHRYTSILVQDSAFMVTVPFFCPDTPHLKKNPVFMYTPDRFQLPNPFKADVAIAIDDVIEPTLDALAAMESQFYEAGVGGGLETVPDDEAGQADRRAEVRMQLASRYEGMADRFRATLGEFYGKERAEAVKYAQAYQLCEYGRQPDREELKRLFPFFSEE